LLKHFVNYCPAGNYFSTIIKYFGVQLEVFLFVDL